MSRFRIVGFLRGAWVEWINSWENHLVMSGVDSIHGKALESCGELIQNFGKVSWLDTNKLESCLSLFVGRSLPERRIIYEHTIFFCVCFEFWPGKHRCSAHITRPSNQQTAISKQDNRRNRPPSQIRSLKDTCGIIEQKMHQGGSTYSNESIGICQVRPESLEWRWTRKLTPHLIQRVWKAARCILQSAVHRWFVITQALGISVISPVF